MNGEQPLTVAALHPGTESDFDALLRIYAVSIPASERKSEAALRAMLQRPAYTFLVARSGSVAAGFSIVARVSAEAALLEYMAVDPKLRGSGIGTQLFKESAAPAVIGSRLLLIEVDSIVEPAPDRCLHKRRIAFYRRSGARLICGLVYRMPQVSAAEPPPMNLYLFSDELPATIEKSRLRGWLESIYAHVYERPRQDPQIAAMLSTVPEQIPLI